MDPAIASASEKRAVGPVADNEVEEEEEDDDNDDEGNEEANAETPALADAGGRR